MAHAQRSEQRRNGSGLTVSDGEYYDPNREAQVITVRPVRNNLDALTAGVQAWNATAAVTAMMREQYAQAKQGRDERGAAAWEDARTRGTAAAAYRLEQDRISRAQEWQAMKSGIDRANDILGAPERARKELVRSFLEGTNSGVTAEVVGAQSLPDTLSQVGDAYQGKSQIYSGAFTFGGTHIGPEQPYGNAARYLVTINNEVIDGSPAVTTQLAKSSTMPLLMQAKGGALAGAKGAPLWSAGGTLLEYAAYNYVGDDFASANNKDWTAQNVGVDMYLDGQKAVVSGAVGVWAAALSGAAAGSVVPGWGTAIGFGVGLLSGAITAWGIESAYDAAGSRDYFKGR